MFLFVQGMLSIGIIYFGGMDDVAIKYHSENPEENSFIYCKAKNTWFYLISMILNNTYGLIAVVFSIPIRSLPDNFHDSKTILITLLANCVACLIAYPFFFFLSTKEEFRYLLFQSKNLSTGQLSLNY